MSKKKKVKSFQVENMYNIYNDINCSIYDVLLLHTGLNRNNSIITKEAVEKSIDTFYNKPLYALLNYGDTYISNDFDGHRFEEKDNDRMRLFGVIPESSEPRWVEKDGKEYLCMRAIVWKTYASAISEILKSREGTVKVSVELEYNEEDSHIEGQGLVIDKFTFQAVTMLGAKVMEGMEGASINCVRFSLEDLNQVYNKVNFSNKEKANDIINKSFDREYGKGETLKIDKRRVSDNSWGEVNKIELRNKVLASPNYKTLIREVYLLVEDNWEQSPSEKLKYPVMEIIDDTLVYNKNALISAKAYAEKENEKSVIDKVEKIEKELDLYKGGVDKMKKNKNEEEIKKDEILEESKDEKKDKDFEEESDKSEDNEEKGKEESDKSEDDEEKEESDKSEDDEEKEEKVFSEEIKHELEETKCSLAKAYEELEALKVEKEKIEKECSEAKEKYESAKKELNKIDNFNSLEKLSHAIDEKEKECLSKEEVLELDKEEFSIRLNNAVADFIMKKSNKEDMRSFSYMPVNKMYKESSSTGNKYLDELMKL